MPFPMHAIEDDQFYKAVLAERHDKDSGILCPQIIVREFVICAYAAICPKML